MVDFGKRRSLFNIPYKKEAIALSNFTNAIAPTSQKALSSQKGRSHSHPSSTYIPKRAIALRRTLRERTLIPTITHIPKMAIALSSPPALSSSKVR
ncbi:hypothetical protein [Argonema galeatum]|uniref:hypothetical protein n=1 Tax=Argonema galeatum TaxID=2942762 RepID=UPI002011047E|nr:hypothetical protein [Argonema galeatum]MCL1466118.1 hypothetical protein [Argonema galeatum A003/A1]